MTNAEFISTVFGPLQEAERYWVTAFPGIPAESSSWGGNAVTTAPDYTNENAYISTAILKQTASGYKKRAENFSRCRLIVLDDVGLEDCSYSLETSEGNFQTGFILTEYITDVEVATRFQKALGNQKLVKADKSGYNAVRYVRLPCAVNAKRAPAWPCRIAEWNPDVRYSLEDFCTRFGLDYSHIVGNAPKDSGAQAATPDWDSGQRVDDAELIRQIMSAESFHDPLLKLTARYAKRGMPAEEIIATVQGMMDVADDGSDRWKSRRAEITRLAKSAAAKFKPDDVDGLPFGSEQQLADELAKIAQGVLRWTPGFDWMRNLGTHWERDDLLGRYTLAKQVCKEAAKDAGKLAPKICASSTTNAILSLARSAQGIVTAVDEWDANPMLLNTPGGVYDLSTGQEVSREGMCEKFRASLKAGDGHDGLLFTQTTRIAPTAAPTPIWDKFLQDVFAGDLEMIEFMQRVMGYCLTGSVTEQKMFFLFGSGANGKSVLLDVLRAIAGKYAHNLPSEALMTSRHERHPTTYAALHGKRLAISSEIEESAHWAESRIKAMTGDETMTARFMAQDEFTFKITHKHLIAGNFKPRLKGDDPAVVRRMVLIPFTQTFAGIRRDNNLPEKLKAEYGGILAWCIEGALKWALAGLAIPQSVAAASEEYMAEHSDLDMWIAESCVVTPMASTSAGELYTDFANWKRRNGEIAPSIKSFSQRLERKHRKTVTRRCAMFQGLCLNGLFEDGAGMPAAPAE